MLDEDLSDEAEFTVDVDKAEYNEEDDADLHLNKLDKKKIHNVTPSIASHVDVLLLACHTILM